MITPWAPRADGKVYEGDFGSDEHGVPYIWYSGGWKVLSDQRKVVLDLLDKIWEQATGNNDPNASLLTDLADASNPNGMVDFRRWLEEVLTR
jgi:hypothetical protein